MSTNRKPRYQTVRYSDKGEYPTTDHTAQFVRVVAPDQKTWIDVTWVGGVFNIRGSDCLTIRPNVSNDVDVHVRRFALPRAKRKNVARKG